MSTEKHFGEVEKARVKGLKYLPWVNVWWYVTESDRKRIKGKAVLAMTMGLRPDYDAICYFQIDGVNETVETLYERLKTIPEMDPRDTKILSELACWKPFEDFEMALDKFIDLHLAIADFDSIGDREAEEQTQVWKKIWEDLNRDHEWAYVT